MQYIFRRGKWFHFKRRIPNLYRNFYDNEIVQVSLKTDSEVIARQRASILNNELEKIWHQVATGAKQKSDDQFQQAVLIARLGGFTYRPAASLLHRMFALAIQWSYLEKNPCANVNKFQENNQRQRFLNNDEIRALFAAADRDANTFAAAYIKFLLLTGVRKSEGLAAKWGDIQVVSGGRIWHIPYIKVVKVVM